MFKRKNRSDGDDEGLETPDDTAPVGDAAAADDTEGAEDASAAVPVPPGPYDSSAVPASEVTRIDIGAMQIAGFTDLQIHFEPDPSGARVVSIVAAYQDAALRLQPLAAPRSGGLWDDMRPQITESIVGIGGDIEEVEGTFGPELHGVVPATTPEGEQVRQPVRLIGVEGPRWLLHGVFMGTAVDNERMAELFEDVFRQTVVVRGDQPMAPGDVIPIQLPPDAQAAQAAEQAANDIVPPPEPGPTITETR